MFDAFRIGFGHDIHVMQPGCGITLGAVVIPCEFSLQGHSDADVLLHAIMDAILGALALGDIGMHFPDTDPDLKGISSRKLLAKVLDMADKSGYAIGNLDCMILCEKPRIAPHRAAIIKALADDLKIETTRINIKAGTNEKCDAVGRCEALVCQAVVLMVKRNPVS